MSEMPRVSSPLKEKHTVFWTVPCRCCHIQTSLPHLCCQALFVMLFSSLLPSFLLVGESSSVTSRKTLALRGASRWSLVFCLKGSRILEIPLKGSFRMSLGLLGILLSHPGELFRLVIFSYLVICYLHLPRFFNFILPLHFLHHRQKVQTRKTEHFLTSHSLPMAKGKKCKQPDES